MNIEGNEITQAQLDQIIAYHADNGLRLNLRGANLTDADLSGADLSGAKNIMALYVENMSTRGDYLYAVRHDSAIMIKAGWSWTTLDAFEQIATSKNRALYIEAIKFIRAVFPLKATV